MATAAHPLPHAHAEYAQTGIWSWLTTVDHKRIGILYGVTAFLFFLLGGAEALVMRWQLIAPEMDVATGKTFNGLFTMHATTMIFLVVMPASAAFFNYMVPLMIGARDVAFPRLNAFSYWVFLSGGIFINLFWLTSLFAAGGLGGQIPDAGWFGYANLTSRQYSPGPGVDFWMIGLQILGVGSLAAGFNFIVTILNMRAPGMTMMRLPVFVWMVLVVQFLVVFAFPMITVGLILLTFDRFFGTNFYVPANGGDPLLWQHLFWLFGHPEVYILILPAMGIVSEVLPTFSRKPLFGAPFVIFSGIVIGLLGFGVWSHHMFTTGLGPVADSAFAITTMLIAIPTAVKIFNWIATVWGGQVVLTTAMYFAVGFVALFVIGGLSGFMHASPPIDLHHQDSYFVVAHIHYVLFGGSVFGLFSGIYYWFPKMTGRLLDEGLGKIHFWATFIFMNVTFFPMHFVGVDGMPRRIFTYQGSDGWTEWNLVSSVGAFLLGGSVLIFIYNWLTSLRRGKVAGNDPWDGATLEWTVPSPPPEHDFDYVPLVTSSRPWWDAKHGPSRKAGAPPALPLAPGLAGPPIHLPRPTFWPLVTGSGIFVFWLGFLAPSSVGLYVSLGGVGLLLFGLYSWLYEPLDRGTLVAAAPTPASHAQHAHPPNSLGLPHIKVGFWTFIGSDCLFFGSLIAAYMAYRNSSQVGPFPHTEWTAPDGRVVHAILNIPITSLSAFVLLMSSVAMVIALDGVVRNHRLQARVWLLATALLGLLFLGFQSFEFTEFYHNGLTLQQNLFGSTFFVLTGFHGTHVAFGVLWLLTMLVQDLRHPIPPSQAIKVEICGLYWHFVDIVWIVIFTFVYLVPTFERFASHG